MSYERQTFINHETVLMAEHLDHIEDGIYKLSITLDGVDSAYDIAKKNGFEGTEEEFLASLKGAKGDKPVKGEDYFTESDKAELVTDVLEALPAWGGGSF